MQRALGAYFRGYDAAKRVLAVREDERAGKKPKTQDALQETELRTIQAEQRIKEERERASKGVLILWYSFLVVRLELTLRTQP